MAEALDRKTYDEVMRAKQLLAQHGYSLISEDQYRHMQKHIAELDNEVSIIYELGEKGLALIDSINRLIGEYNTKHSGENSFIVPEGLSIAMSRFTIILYDIYTRYLPLPH